MKLHWTDVNDIAIELSEVHADVDPRQLRFTKLRDWVLALENFDDDPGHCGEKILEAIQMAWIEELD
jgi:FeS assembly protein IscX